MGIKDWLGGEKIEKMKELFQGDKKKQEFRDHVKEALQDGRLDSKDLKELEEKRQELGVTDARDDRTVIRRALFNEAVDAVRKDGELTATDQHELGKIQKFLALRDDQIEQTKWNIQRLRTLTDIKSGNLPTMPSNSTALRGVQFEPGEIAHYSLGIDLFDQGSTRGADGVRALWAGKYDGSARVHTLPEGGAKPIGEGTIVITNKRLILKTGSRTAAIKYAPDSQIYLYNDGLRLQKTIGSTLLRFKSGSEETGEIVAELLSALMR
jgi:hypothetical protein